MKVGDLVALSSYGMQRKRAGWIDVNDVGIITKIYPRTRHRGGQYYEVQWQNSKYPRNYYWVYERENYHKDLKYAK